MADEFVSASCQGEKCSMCGAPATKKVGEEIPHDDPMPIRHNMTAYVCDAHFVAIFSPRSQPKFGPTGKFPMPAISDDDEGELRMGVRYDPINGIIEVAFGAPVAWLGFPPESAIELARTLLDKAGYGEIP